MRRSTERKKKRLKQAARNRQRAAGEEQKKREKVDRRRSIVVDVTEMDGVKFDEPHVAVVIEPVRLSDARDLYIHSPFVVPFYLVKAKELRDGAEPKRLHALERIKRETDGTYRPNDPVEVLDALEDLALSVVLSMAAIEAHANDAIGRLPDDATIEIPHRVNDQTIWIVRDKRAMVWFKLGQKLEYAVPALTGRPMIKGNSRAWPKFRQLARIRNGLLHPERVALNDPTRPGPFGRLMLGQGSKAPEDAAFVIEELEPGWIPSEVRHELGLSDSPPAQ